MNDIANCKAFVFYATISSSQPGGPGHYQIEVHAEDRDVAENIARKIVHDHTGGKWSFMYDNINKVHELDRRVIGLL